MGERRMTPWSIAIVLSLLIFLPNSLQAGVDSIQGSCPAGYDVGLFNANGPGCTFCTSQDAACESADVGCLGPPLQVCPPQELEACCAANPCAEPCPGPKPLECSVSSCTCDPGECCTTNCPAPAPALGSPQSFNFLFAAAGLAAAGLFLVARRSRRRQ
jgi:hypothetical protein